jgi:hypothetical protein
MYIQPGKAAPRQCPIPLPVDLFSVLHLAPPRMCTTCHPLSNRTKCYSGSPHMDRLYATILLGPLFEIRGANYVAGGCLRRKTHGLLSRGYASSPLSVLMTKALPPKKLAFADESVTEAEGGICSVFGRCLGLDMADLRGLNAPSASLARIDYSQSPCTERILGNRQNAKIAETYRNQTKRRHRMRFLALTEQATHIDRA